MHSDYQCTHHVCLIRLSLGPVKVDTYLTLCWKCVIRMYFYSKMGRKRLLLVLSLKCVFFPFYFSSFLYFITAACQCNYTSFFLSSNGIHSIQFLCLVESSRARKNFPFFCCCCCWCCGLSLLKEQNGST